MVGHLLGAMEVLRQLYVKSIQDGFMHKNVGLINKDPECDLDFDRVKRGGSQRGTISSSLDLGVAQCKYRL